MNPRNSFKCVLLAEDRVLYEGEAADIELPSASGPMSVFPGHAEIFGVLIAGRIGLKPRSGSPQDFEIKGGTFHLGNKGLIATVELGGKDLQRQDAMTTAKTA